MYGIQGKDPGLTKSEDATHLATDGPAPRRYDRCTAHTVRCAAVFVRSEKSNAASRSSVTVSSNLSSVVNSPSTPRISSLPLYLVPGFSHAGSKSLRQIEGVEGGFRKSEDASYGFRALVDSYGTHREQASREGMVLS